MTSRARRVLVSALVAILLLIVVAPLLLPLPSAPGTLPLHELAYPDSEWIELDGVPIHYRQSGSQLAETTFILLHGFGASTFSFERQLELLVTHGRVIAYDRPGFGLSARPMPGYWTGDNPYGLEANAHRVIRLMDALEIRHAVLIGHSAGAEVAVAAAALYPDRVSGLVLEAPAVYSGSAVPEWAKWLMRTPQARRIGPRLVRWQLVRNGDDLIRSAYADPDAVDAETLEGYRLPLQAPGWDRALWEFSAAPETLSAEELLAEIRMPTLVLTGVEDTWVDSEESLRAYKRITRPKLAPGDIDATVPGRFVEVDGAGHLPHEEQPVIFAQEVIRFLEEMGVDAECES